MNGFVRKKSDYFLDYFNCKWECDKSCDVGEYLSYANCKCWKYLIDKLVEECNEDINENEIIHNVALNDHKKNMQFL